MSRCALQKILIGVALAASASACHQQVNSARTIRGGGPLVIQRLTPQQYRQSIADIFGPDIKIGPLPPILNRQAGLLEVGAAATSIPPSDLEKFASAARSIAAQVTDEKHRSALIGCPEIEKHRIDPSCADRFISEVGRLLYRRPLVAEEMRAQRKVARAALSDLGGAYAGIEANLTSMLTAPQFLFRWETTEPDSAEPRLQRLDGYSRAMRLSFFLWNTTPDQQLLDVAESNKIQTMEEWDRQVDRMLHSPRLEDGVRAFFEDMLGFDGFGSLSKDPTLYPKFTTAVADDVQEQTLKTILDTLLTRDGDYRDLFTTRSTFLTRRLGAIYGVAVIDPEGWQPFQFSPRDPRGAGILSQASFVALHSHPGRSSPTLRGKAIRQSLLCQRVPDPPGNVDFKLVEDTNNPAYRTARQRLTAHATQPMCTGCHKLMDPIGLGLENFDTGGSYRQAENGAVIDPSGRLDGIDFKSAVELGRALHDNPATVSCLVTRVYEYAVGRSLTTEETKWIQDDLKMAFEKHGHRLVPLMRDIVTSGQFVEIHPQSPAIVASQGPVQSLP